mgnify:CR=1 FL=1
MGEGEAEVEGEGEGDGEGEGGGGGDRRLGLLLLLLLLFLLPVPREEEEEELGPAWFMRQLWRPDWKVSMNIPDTLLLDRNGQLLCWLFSTRAFY